MERINVRIGAVALLLFAFTAGTERGDLAWSAPQARPADVVGDADPTPAGIEEPAAPVEDKGGTPDDAQREAPADKIEDDIAAPGVIDPAGGDVGVVNPDGVRPDEPDVVGLCVEAVDPQEDVVDPGVDDGAATGDSDDGIVGDLHFLRITEIMYNPPERPSTSRRASSTFEYIEFLNLSDLPLALGGIRLSSAGGVRLRFPSGTILGAGMRAVAVRDLEAFASGYEPCEGTVLAGQYTGCLGDDGDFIVLADRLERKLIAFEYSDRWYPSTDGEGAALALFDESVPPEHYGKIGVWMGVGPNPGCESGMHDVGQSLQLPGDTNQDAFLDISDAVLMLGHLFGGTQTPLPCEGTSINFGGNLILLDVNGDYTVNVNDALYLLNGLFAMGYPPVRGTSCIPIQGCPFNAQCPSEEGE